MREIGALFDKAMGLRRGTGVNLIWHSLATNRWTTDPDERLDPARPLIGAARVRAPVAQTMEEAA